MIINQCNKPYVAPMLEVVGVDVQMQTASISIIDPIEKSLDDPDDDEGELILFPRKIFKNSNKSCNGIWGHDDGGARPF